MKQLLRMGLCVLCATVVLTSKVQAGVSGFVDAQLYTPGQSDTTNSPAFKINDGAVYFSKELGKGKAMVDIPFSGGLSSNSFSVGTNKAQAYVNYAYDFGLDWTLGQFDTPFGFEANDTVNVAFTNQGTLYNALPTTHTGLMLGYTSGGLNVKAGVSQAFNAGLRNGDNFEYFGQLKYTQSPYYFAVGYLHHKNVTSAESSMLVDIGLGGKFSELTVDADVVLMKAAVSGATTGVGFLLNAVYAINKTWAFGVRPEYLSKYIPRTTAGELTATPTDSILAVTAGPSANVTDDLKVKVDYTFLSTKVTSGATAVTNHSAALAAVYKW